MIPQANSKYYAQRAWPIVARLDQVTSRLDDDRAEPTIGILLQIPWDAEIESLQRWAGSNLSAVLRTSEQDPSARSGHAAIVDVAELINDAEQTVRLIETLTPTECDRARLARAIAHLIAAAALVLAATPSMT